MFAFGFDKRITISDLVIDQSLDDALQHSWPSIIGCLSLSTSVLVTDKHVTLHYMILFLTQNLEQSCVNEFHWFPIIRKMNV